jgi:hypothetical protein
MARGKGHDHSRSNIAADYEVNGILVANDILSKSDVKDFLYADEFVNKAYEVIYAANPKGPSTPKPQEGGQQGSGESGNGGDSGSGSGSGSDQDDKPKSEDWIRGWNKALEDYKNGKIKL